GLDVFISKPADDCCGRGVEKIKISDYESLDAVYDHLVENGSGIAEDSKWAKNSTELYVGHYPGEYSEKQTAGIGT
ncbi:MAG: hypothetical protein IKR73_08980, partial [Oscillospiraceae bacterium]|nr:hypothetical protein [Oscillospiraceae bacterium]